MNEIVGIVSLIAAVAVGGSIVFLLKQRNEQNIIKPLLAFSGGFLLSIAFIHFVPEIYTHNTESIGIYILLGFIIQLSIEYFTGGIEHGHVHAHKSHSSKLPWGLLIGLSVHSILEGIPLYAQLSSGEVVHSNHNHAGASFLLAVILHKIPEAIALTTLFVKNGWKKRQIFAVLTAFALMSPLGIILGYFVPFVFENYVTDIILAVVIGMFLHISTTIIFETAEGHRFNLIKLTSILAGVLLAMLMH